MRPTDFLLEVWKKQTKGYFCISTKSVRTGVWRDHFIKPLTKRRIRQVFDSHSPNTHHFYFCPVSFTQPKRRKEYASPGPYLHADLDEVNPERVQPPPQILWETSPGRYSCMWYLDTVLSPEKLEEFNRETTYANGADRSGWDLTQVLRIPGLKNYKYKDNPRGKLLRNATNTYGIKDFIFTKPSAKGGDLMDKLKKLSIRTWFLIRRKGQEGYRSEILFKLGRTLIELGFSDSDTLSLLKGSGWNKFAGRTDEDQRLREIIEKTGAKPKQKVDSEIPAEDNGFYGAVRMSDVEPSQVSWLWRPYIPRGKLTILEGDGGLGKSWLTLAISCALSKGNRLPGGRALSGSQRVLIYTTEDALDDTIRPRIDQLGGEPSNIFCFPLPEVFDDEGLERIENMIKAIEPALVILDPIVAYIGHIDYHKANETRSVLSELSVISQRYNIAMLAIRHLKKGAAGKAMSYGLGSVDFFAAVRSVLFVGQHPEDADLRVMCQTKLNVDAMGRSVQFALTRETKCPFSWQGFCDMTANEIVQVDGIRDRAIDDAIEMIKKIIRETNGKKCYVRILTRKGRNIGLTSEIIQRALSTNHFVVREGKVKEAAQPQEDKKPRRPRKAKSSSSPHRRAGKQRRAQ